ncbi:MAG: hypothetical protein ISS15_05320 [Alphaproteobacteria bacterium]|nr:hypothetical protein [Alphaproteobacteria bacterium]MBL6939460.1 hypothetical protein [Alphaproteobacteria bacterium]MBL7097059.1 hypothetical protein [Alphaproteobacteria bacterium]
MRIPGWEDRLIAVIEAYRKRAFAWGQADCLLLASDAVKAVRGDDPAAPYRSTYADERGAARVLLSLNARTAPELLAHLFPGLPLAAAKRGDLAVIREPSAEDPFGAIGIVLGESVAGYGADGLQFVSRLDCTRAFEVG